MGGHDTVESRYTLTTDGQQFAIFYTKVHDRVLRPLLRRHPPNAPPELRAALHTIDQAVDQHLTHARLPKPAKPNQPHKI